MGNDQGPNKQAKHIRGINIRPLQHHLEVKLPQNTSLSHLYSSLEIFSLWIPTPQKEVRYQAVVHAHNPR